MQISHAIVFYMSLTTKLVTEIPNANLTFYVFFETALTTQLVTEIRNANLTCYGFFLNVFNNSTCNRDSKCKSHMLLFVL